MEERLGHNIGALHGSEIGLAPDLDGPLDCSAMTAGRQRGKEVERHASIPERWRVIDDEEDTRNTPTPQDFLRGHRGWLARPVPERELIHAVVSDAFVMGRHIAMIREWVHRIEGLAAKDILPPSDPDNMFAMRSGLADPFWDGLGPLNELARALWPHVHQIHAAARAGWAAAREPNARLSASASANTLLSFDARRLIPLLVVRAERTSRILTPVTPAELEATYAWVVCDACALEEARDLLVDCRRSTEAWRVALAEHRGRPGGKPINQSHSSRKERRTSVERIGFVEKLEPKLLGLEQPAPAERKKKERTKKTKKKSR